MHHEPSSTVFESHYSNLTTRIDLFAIATNEAPVPNMDTTSAALMRVEKNTVDREEFLKRFISQDATVVKLMGLEDESIKAQNDLRLARRSARRMGVRALEVLEKSLMEKYLTTDEVLRRRRGLEQPSILLQRVKEIGQRLQAEAPEKAVELLPEFRVVDPDSPPEAMVELDSECDFIDSAVEMVIMFESLLMVLLETKDKPLDPEVCQLCVEDETLEVPFIGPPF